MMRQKELQDFVKVALECSVYVAPTKPGLSRAELVEIGKLVDFHEGELNDAIRLAEQAGSAVWNGGKLVPVDVNPLWDQFHHRTDPDFRVVKAFDYVHGELRDLARKLGTGKGSMDRAVLVERGVAKGLKAHDIEVAITVLHYAQHLAVQDGVVTLVRSREGYPLASEQLASSGNLPVRDRGLLRKVHPLVRDAVGRRSHGRSSAVEAFEAFADKLAPLGYPLFRSWWIQTVSELRRLDLSLNPVAVAVFSAALVEGCLTFVVQYARALKLGPMGSKTFDGQPQTWKIDDLVASAAAGGPSAILDPSLRARADMLIKTRQRIHAGRMLVEHPQGVPDFRPEEARDAKQTAELVVRHVIDWIERHPASPPAS